MSPDPDSTASTTHAGEPHTTRPTWRRGDSIAGAPAVSSATWAFYLLLTSALVLYVYRFAVAGVNLSAFRLLLLAWIAWLVVGVARGRIRDVSRYAPLIALGAGIVVINVLDFLTLSGYPALRRDIANHLLNVVFAGLVALYVDTAVRRRALLRAFVLSSVITTAVGLYTAIYDRLPFEWLIRTLGSQQAQRLSYINDDLVFRRATSTFFDPNIYAIYSALVIVVVMYLWRFDRRAPHLPVLFAVNLVCLTLTLSRTAVVGLLAAFIIAALVDRRSLWFSVVGSVAVVGLLYASTAVQSYEGNKALRLQAQAAWESLTSFNESLGPGEAGGAGSAGSSEGQSRGRVSRGADAQTPSSAEAREAVQDRVVSARSLSDRLSYINRGIATFQGSPVWGGGSSALVTEEMPLSSAHVSYLTLLARYGLLGAAVYGIFLLYPIAMVWRRGRAHGDRYLVSTATGALMVVYLSYDVFLFFEVQYLLFGIGYSIALEPGGRSVDSTALPWTAPAAPV